MKKYVEINWGMNYIDGFKIIPKGTKYTDYAIQDVVALTFWNENELPEKLRINSVEEFNNIKIKIPSLKLAKDRNYFYMIVELNFFLKTLDMTGGELSTLYKIPYSYRIMIDQLKKYKREIMLKNRKEKLEDI